MIHKLSPWIYPLICMPLVCFGQTPSREVIESADGTHLRALLLHPTGISSDQKRPLVIALHGCGGLYATSGSNVGKLNARHDGMAQLITANGYSILFPDSFTSRGENSLCTQKLSTRKIKQSHRSDDVDGVLIWLDSQPWADKSKIALLGWSHGGSAVLRSTDANRDNVAIRKTQPSIAIAFYPGCADALQNNYRPQSPLLMLLGELDDWTPPGPCIELAKNVSANYYVYPDSYHDFDNPVGFVKLRTDVPNGVNPGKGVTVGRNPITGPLSWEKVIATLREKWH